MLSDNLSTAPVHVRRSARKKPKHESNSIPDTKTSDEANMKKQGPVAQTSSRTRAVNGPGRRAGKLASMSDMPLDVLFEIFGHLHPYDLLKLSRTTKDYRKLLLDPHSVTLWKTACQNVEGLPEPFEGICLPAWVNLLFYPHCHFCSRVAHTIEWVFRLRICSHCAPQYLGKTRARFYMGPSRLFHSTFPIRIVQEHMVPSRPSNNNREIFYLQSEQDAVCAQHDALQTDAARLQFIEDRKAWVQVINKHVTVCQAWEKKQSSHRENELQTLREERLSAIKERLKELGWQQDLNGIRHPDSLARHKQVNKPQRLTNRIWSNIRAEVIQFMEEMREKRLKREHNALIVARKVIAADFWRAYQVSHVHDRQLLPNPVEFCSFKPVADLINQDSEIVVTLTSYQSLLPQLDDFVSQWRDSINASFYEQLKEPVSVYCREQSWDDGSHYSDPFWDSEDDYEDWNGFRSTKPIIEPSPFRNLSTEEIESRVKLAQTVFSCSKCSKESMYEDSPWYSNLYGGQPASGKHDPLFYPQVLGHQCCDCKVRVCMDDDDFYTMFMLSPPKFLPLLQKWSPQHLSIDLKMSNLASHMLSAVDNIDPNTVTVEEMDQLNIRYTCLQRKCLKEGPPKSDAQTPLLPGETGTVSWCSPSFDWRGVIQHHMNEHGGELEGINSKYAIEEQSAIPATIREEERLYMRDRTAGWACMHCNKSEGGEPCRFPLIKSHISVKHKIQDITEDQDYTRVFDWLNIHPSLPFLRPVCITPNGLVTLN